MNAIITIVRLHLQRNAQCLLKLVMIKMRLSYLVTLTIALALSDHLVLDLSVQLSSHLVGSIEARKIINSLCLFKFAVCWGQTDHEALVLAIMGLDLVQLIWLFCFATLGLD